MSSTRVYVAEGGQLVTLLEAFLQLEWTRSYRTSGTVYLQVHRDQDGAELLIADGVGKEISIVDDPLALSPDITYIIERVVVSFEGPSQDLIEVTGVEAGLLNHRIALPPPFNLGSAFTSSHHLVSGSAETAMIELVDNNAGPSADTPRQVPLLTLATDQTRGPVRDWQSRFQVVSEQLKTWGHLSGLGYQVFRTVGGSFEFQVLEGQDLTDLVVFDVALDNVHAQTWTRDGSDQQSLAYVAGQGGGTDRSVIDAHLTGTAPTGADRREVFIDARDLETVAGLEERGEERLSERRIEESFSISISPVAQFQYKRDWDLGDIVTLRNQAWGLTREARVVEVVNQLDSRGILTRNLTLGAQLKDIRARVLDSLGDRGSERE